MKTRTAYFGEKKAVKRHLQVNEDVRGSAFRDFMKSVKSSQALLFALKEMDKKTSFPELELKSKFETSKTIEIRTRAISGLR